MAQFKFNKAEKGCIVLGQITMPRNSLMTLINLLLFNDPDWYPAMLNVHTSCVGFQPYIFS